MASSSFRIGQHLELGSVVSTDPSQYLEWKDGSVGSDPFPLLLPSSLGIGSASYLWTIRISSRLTITPPTGTSSSYSSRMTVGSRISQTGGGTGISTALEKSLGAITIEVAHLRLVIGGPDAPGNKHLDPSEPYDWAIPVVQQDEVYAFITAYLQLDSSVRETTILTLDDLEDSVHRVRVSQADHVLVSSTRIGGRDFRCAGVSTRGSDSPEFPTGWFDGDEARFSTLRFCNDGSVDLGFTDDSNSYSDNATFQTSEYFRNNLRIGASLNGNGILLIGTGDDESEPFQFTPSNSDEVIAMSGSLPSDTAIAPDATSYVDFFLPEQTTEPLSIRGSLTGPAALINGRLVLENNTLEITGSLVGPVARVAGRLETGIPGGFVVTFPHDEFSSLINYAIWDNSVAQPGPADWFEDATLTAAHRSVDRFLITTAGLVQVNFGTGDVQALKTSILSRIEIGLTLADGSTLTLHGIRDGDETDPYSWTPPNASAANAYRAKVMTLTDHTLVARFTLTDVPPIEITGTLTGPAAQINGRLALGADTPLTITGSLVGPAALISGRVALGSDQPLEITGALTGPAALMNGRLTIGTDTTLEITGSLVGPVAQINGRLALGDIALPFGTDAINIPAGTKTLDWIVLAVLRATINGADITVDPVSPRQGELVVAANLTIDGVERHSSPFPLIRLRKDGSADFSDYFDNEGSPRYPRAKLFIQTTAAGPAIPFTIASTGGGFNNWNIDAGYDRTDITAIQTGDFFILAIAETPTPLTITGALTGPAAQINGRLALVEPLEITGSLVGPAAQINGRLALGTDTPLTITGSLVGPAALISGRVALGSDQPLEITGALTGPAALMNGRLTIGTDTTLEITGSLVGPVAQINGRLALGDIALPFGTDAINIPAGTKTLDWIVLAVLRATINGADITVDPVSPRQGELVVAANLTIDGVERHSSPFPLIRLRKDGSADFSDYFDNEGSPRYPRAKLFIQTTAAGPAIPFTIASTGGGFNNWNIDAGYDRTDITAIQTGDFFILAIAETPTPLTITGALTGPAAQINGRLALVEPLEITGSLVGPAAQINGRLALGTDTPLTITGSLVGPAALISGRVALGSDQPLEITGALTGPAALMNGRLTIGTDTTLEITGSLVGPVAQINGRLALGDIALPFGTDAINIPAGTKTLDWIVLAVLRATINGADITVDPVSPRQGELVVAANLTIDGVERHSSPFPLIRLRKDGSADFSDYFDNEGSPRYPRAKLFIQTTAAGPAIPFTIASTGGGFNNWNIDAGYDRTDITAIQTGDFFILAIAETPTPLTITGALTGPAAQINGRLALVEPLEITGSLVGPAAQINGRLALGTDTPLTITGSLVGPAALISGRVALGSDQPLEITGALVGPVARMTGRVLLSEDNELQIHGILVGPASRMNGRLVTTTDTPLEITGSLVGLAAQIYGRLALGTDAPLEITGSLVGPAARINGRLVVGADTPLEITGSLTGPAAQINGRLALGTDALLEITGALTGPAARVNGRLALGSDQPLEITGSLVGPAARISGRVALGADTPLTITGSLTGPPALMTGRLTIGTDTPLEITGSLTGPAARITGRVAIGADIPLEIRGSLSGPFAHTSGRLRVKTTAVTPTDLTVGAPTITLTKGLQEIPPVDAWEAIRECAEADPEMPPEGAIQQLGVLLNAMRENLELLRANPTIALTGFVPSAAAPGVPDDAFNPAAFFPWSYGIRYNRRNVSQATSSGGGTYILETPDGASGNFLVVGELSADEVIPWGDVRRITFHGRGANGVDYSELLRSDGLDGNDVIIGIRRVEPDGSVDVVGFLTTGDVLALAGNTFQIPVVRATGFDSGQIDDVLPAHDEDYDVWLVIPDISRYDSLGNNAHLTPRVSGHFWRLIDANLAAELMALGDTDPWHAAAVLEANAATPGANFRGDIVTLYRADFQSNRAWDPVTGEWVVFTAFFGGTLIADNGIIASHIAAGAILADKIAVGAVNAAKILDDAITTAKILDDAITTAKILAGAVGASEISSLAISTAKILDDAITSAKILAGAVSSGKIPTGAILAEHIIANAIISSKIAAGAIVASKIAAGTIAALHIAANAITAIKIQAGAITASKIAAGVLPTNFSDLEGQIGTADIAAGAIIADKIAANAIIASKIRANAITAIKIQAGAITASKIAAGVLPTNFSDLEGQIGTADIAAGAIIADKIAANAIIASKIRANAIIASKIRANAITAIKIQAGAITASKIAAGVLPTNFSDLEGQIGTADIATGAIIADKIAANAIIASKIRANAITAIKIQAGAITASKIAAGVLPTNFSDLEGQIGTADIATGAIIADKIAANAIIASKIRANAITASKIAAGVLPTNFSDLEGQIGTADIAAGAIIADKIAANAIIASKIRANAITAIKIQAGAITASKIAAGVLPTNFSDLEGQIGTADIAAGAIIADKIAANAIIASKIRANAITAIKIQAGAITASKIAAGVLPTNFSDLEGQIGTADIATGAIIADKIAANAIIASKIRANAITAIKIKAKTITAEKLAFDLITGDTLIADNAFITKLIANVRNVDVLFESTSGVGTGRRDADTSITEFSLTKSINGMTLIQGIARDSVYEPWAVPVSKLPNGTGTSRPSGYAHVQMSGQSDVYMWKSSDGRKVYMQLPGRGDRSLIFDIIGITNPTGESGSSTGGGGGGGTTITTDTDSIYRRLATPPGTPSGGTSTQTHTPAGWSRTQPEPTTTRNVYRSQRTRTYTDGTFTSATAWGSVVKILDKAAGATTRTDSIWERGSSTPSTPSGGTNDEFHQPGGWNRTNPGPTTVLNVYRSDRTIHLLNGAFQRASVWGTPVKVTDKTGAISPPPADTVTTDTDYIYRLGLFTPTTPSGGNTTETHTPSTWTRNEGSPTNRLNVYRSQRTRTYVNDVFTSATAWGDPVKIKDKTGAITTDTDSIYRLGTSAPSTPSSGTSTQTHAPAGWSRTQPEPTTTQNVYRSQRTRTYTGGSFTSATAWGAVAKILDKLPAITTDTDSIYRLGTSAPAKPTGGTSTQTHAPAGWSRTQPEPTTTRNVYRSQRTRTYTDGTFTSATAWGAVAKILDKLPANTRTDTDSIYRRLATPPGTPSGGTSTQTHTPSLWSRSNPSATTTLNVYRSQRTRTYVNDVFTSATAWGDPVKIKDKTGAITTDTDSIYRLGTSAPSTPSSGTSTQTHTPAGWSRTQPEPTTTRNVYRSQRTRTYTGGSFTSATAWGAVAKILDKLPEITTDTDSIYRRLATPPGTPSGGTSTQTHTPSLWSRSNPSATTTLNVYRSQRTRTYVNDVFTSATAWGDPVKIKDKTGAITTDTDSIYRLGTSAPSTPSSGTSTQTHAPAGWSRTQPEPTTTQNVYRSQRTRTYTGGSFTSATAWGAVAKILDKLPAITTDTDYIYRRSSTSRPSTPSGGTTTENHLPSGWDADLSINRPYISPNNQNRFQWVSRRTITYTGGSFTSATAWGTPINWWRLDHVYRTARSIPNKPTGGASSQTYLPSGWSRTRPSQQDVDDVYPNDSWYSYRALYYSKDNGSFARALAWTSVRRDRTSVEEDVGD